MTPEEILLSLYNLRVELERDAIQKYQRGIGLPYTVELREIDKQIAEISKRVAPSFITTSAITPEVKTDNKETQPQPNSQILTAADKKKLCVLEKLKEQWDLAPADYEKNGVRIVLVTSIPDERYDKWIRECELDDEQRLTDILTTFQREGIIVSSRKIANFI